VRPGVGSGVARGKRLVQVGVRRLEGDAATPVRHGVARVDHEVHEDLPELPGVGSHGREAGAGNDDEVDVLSDQALEHGLHVGHDRVEVEHARLAS